MRVKLVLVRLRLCRSNDSIFHERSIVPGMAFIHYSFNFKWSFVDTFLGSCPDPCLWPGRYLSSSSLLQHDHLAHRLPYWKLGLKRCSVFRSLANGSPGVYVVSFVPPANYQCSLHGRLIPPSEISARTFHIWWILGALSVTQTKWGINHPKILLIHRQPGQKTAVVLDDWVPIWFGWHFTPLKFIM